MRVCPAAGSFVLVMGSKNNNGKFDFKAARTKVHSLWKGKSPAGLSDDLDLNGVTELWRGGKEAPAVCSHLSSQTKKELFLLGRGRVWSAETSIVVFGKHLIGVQFRLDELKYKFSVDSVIKFFFRLWFIATKCKSKVAFSVVCVCLWGEGGVHTFSQCHCEIYILAVYRA